MSDDKSKAHDTIYKVPESELKGFLEQFREAQKSGVNPENIPLFKDHARINLQLIPKLLLLRLPEARVLSAILCHLKWRNMVTFTLEELSQWIVELGRKPGGIQHLSTSLLKLQEADILKEVERTPAQFKGGKETVTYCVHPEILFRGAGRSEHMRLLLEWDDNEITPPNRKRRKCTPL